MTRNFLTLIALLTLMGLARGENRLAEETSPHLRDHAGSLVDWYPWGEEAFEHARKTKKPIFLSIGYHSCHWCHTMLTESFNDPATAKLLNDNFVNIKIDRAEHPDIDRTYMTYIQATQGSGGWPLNVWLTADLVPFSVGTYYPAKSSGTQPEFKKILNHIVSQWKRFPDYIDAQSKRDFAKLRSQIQELPFPDPTDRQSPEQHRLAAYERLSSEFDPVNGGFGDIPRFPSPAKIGLASFLQSNLEPDSFRARQCKKMVHLSLEKMSAGGIHDQVGGGFFRYTSDPGWAIPHFEKMLNDQALMMNVYLDGFRSSGDRRYLEVAKSIAVFLDTTLRSADGAYFSSVHSDSRPDHDAEKIEEGAYYVWGAEEFATAVGDDAEVLGRLYNIRPGGNLPIGGIASPTLRSTNVLHRPETMKETASHFGLSPDKLAAILTRGRKSLLKARGARPAPAIDSQIITAWNGLLVSAYARAFTVTGEKTFLTNATAALEFIRTRCFDQEEEILYRIVSDDKPKHVAAAEDFAFTIQACLDLYEAGFDERLLEFAVTLQTIYDREFFDKRLGGYFNTRQSRSDIIIRLKSYEDGAEISPNAISILNLIRLGGLLGDKKMISQARKSFDCFRGAVDRAPSISYRLLLAESILSNSQTQVVIVGKPGTTGTDALLAAARDANRNDLLVVLLDPSAPGGFLTKRNPSLAKFKPLEGRATAFVCRDFSCKEPSSDPETVGIQLRSR